MLIDGARISFVFQQILAKEINSFDVLDDLEEIKIKTVIMNLKGLKPSIFVPEQAFETLIRQQLGRLKQSSENCVYMIHEELRKIASRTTFLELQNYEV